VLGLAVAAATRTLLVTYAERYTSRAIEISIDHNVLLFTLGMSVLTGLIFGSVPAWSARFDVAPALRDGGRSTHVNHGLRSALIVGQVAASFMLLIAAGLTLRSLMKLQSIDPGFRTENLVTWRADMSFDKFPLSLNRQVRNQKISDYWVEFETRLRAIQGVTEVAGGGTFPLNERGPFSNGLQRESKPLPPGVQPPQADYRIVSSEYFKTLGQPLVSGRAFNDSDTLKAPGVVIINESAARHFWPNENPIGSRISGGTNAANEPIWLTVVGVVADVRQQLEQAPRDDVYVPLRQFGLTNTTWVVHSTRPVEQIARDVKAMGHSHDPDLPIANFRTLAEVRSSSIEQPRVTTSLIGIFALLALVITAAGIAGVIAFSVNQRTQEFGIRMALGAPRAGVLGMVLKEGLILVVIGLVIGMAGALALTHVLQTLLFEVQPTDSLTFLAVSTVLVMVAVLACLLPAKRAASVDPMVALRAL
jgi:putative ABC transport system permease protein